METFTHGVSVSTLQKTLGTAEVKTTNWEQGSLGCGPGSASNLHFSLPFGPFFFLTQKRVEINDLERKKDYHWLHTASAGCWYAIGPQLKRAPYLLLSSAVTVLKF